MERQLSRREGVPGRPADGAWVGDLQWPSPLRSFACGERPLAEAWRPFGGMSKAFPTMPSHKGVRFGNPKEQQATPEAIEQVYRSRFHAFLKVAASVAGERHAADAVHDGFARALRHRRSFRGESPLEAWLWRLVLNAAIDARGGETTRTLDDPLALEDRQPAEQEADHEGDLIRKAIAKLPPRQRLAVWLRYYVDLDYEAIGEILLIRPGTVAATLHGARSAIRRELEEARCKII